MSLNNLTNVKEFSLKLKFSKSWLYYKNIPGILNVCHWYLNFKFTLESFQPYFIYSLLEKGKKNACTNKKTEIDFNFLIFEDVREILISLRFGKKFLEKFKFLNFKIC